MTYIAVDDSADGTVKVLYESKDGKAIKTFDALDWLAQLVTHISTKEWVKSMEAGSLASTLVFCKNCKVFLN